MPGTTAQVKLKHILFKYMYNSSLCIIFGYWAVLNNH